MRLTPRTRPLAALICALPCALLWLMAAGALGAWREPLRDAAGPDSAGSYAEAAAWAWPVRGTGGAGPPVLRGWDPPASPYGPGHRGVDLAAPPGTEVRAPAPGRIAYAGRVANRGVLTIDHADTGDPPLRTTYEPVRALVEKGDEVAAGEVVARVERPRTGDSVPHCPQSCLHWGLRRGTAYLDPLALLPPRLLDRGPSRLLPLGSALDAA
ncbi:murein hydrolase activator EnvC family protein [Streptomyces sp. Da 82-17]|uniref:murein hydrolase activator EnvC family protein n=1 Tax=Streptomyces sp. Da 82-17 TaxID=3377116 RepID=UPI0038D43066